MVNIWNFMTFHILGISSPTHILFTEKIDSQLNRKYRFPLYEKKTQLTNSLHHFSKGFCSKPATSVHQLKPASVLVRSGHQTWDIPLAVEVCCFSYKTIYNS